MPLLSDIMNQANLSLLSYGINLDALSSINDPVTNLKRLVGDGTALNPGQGLTLNQLNAIAADGWTVVAQSTDTGIGNSGASATVFEKDGVRYLAVRGTEFNTASDVAADVLLALGLDTSMHPQVQYLESVVQEWIADGTLPAQFTITGHSLGGYVATGLERLQSLQGHITDVYLFNAPRKRYGISALG